MYKNLNAELARASITRKELAEIIDIPYSTLLDKLSGRTQLTFGEARKIKKALNLTAPLDEIFLT